MKNLLELLPKSKVLRDPLYGNVPIEYKVILDIIDTKEFQRLRRVRQLSGVSIVFHTAEHSRFSHSIGTYYIAYRFVNESVLKDYLQEEEKVLFMISALLHDIGHGPFSHAFEKAFAINHEEIGSKIITGNTEVGNLLKQYGNLALEVASILQHKSKHKIIESLISSQLDVDRLDYLNRDASMTNANYGFVDVDRIIRILRIKDGRVCFDYKGLHTIENYLMSRYHMYWQIYYHKAARSYEVVLEQIYHYINDIKASFKIDYSPAFMSFLEDNNNLEAYLKLDDYYIVGMILELEHHQDKTLAYLASCFLNRHLFSHETIEENGPTKPQLDIMNHFRNNEELKYFYKEEMVSQSAYLKSKRNLDINDILILKDDKLLKLEDASKIVSGLILSGKKELKNIFYDKNKL